MMETTISFLVKVLPIWRMIKNQFESVRAETNENYPAWKLQIDQRQTRNTCHQGGI